MAIYIQIDQNSSETLPKDFPKDFRRNCQNVAMLAAGAFATMPVAHGRLRHDMNDMNEMNDMGDMYIET